MHIEQLRSQIRHLEANFLNSENIAVPVGVPALDNCLSNRGLGLGRVHEVVGGIYSGVGDVTPSGFVIALLVRIITQTSTNKRILWCSSKKKRLFARLSSTGLHWFGLDPHRIIQVNVISEIDQLWVMEEGLKCPDLMAVVIELGESNSNFYTRSSVAWRRFQLAAEVGGVTGFVLRSNIRNPGALDSLPESRWRVTALPSNSWYPKWKLELLRSRNGKKSSSIVIWDPTIRSFKCDS
ncbi:MAG: hypothetical protein CMM58_12880 [Rhodospirillaceae bacterium]|nr:hypothetical protein [Rhodospirillaceae bacterium]|tara:strand:- start:1396 stop:2109 length:714 start_codon:yes stop_codon:yes gene_type:complete